jgi:hypothetical protein
MMPLAALIHAGLSMTKGTSEDHTQWVNNKTSPFSSPSTPR